MGDRVKKAVTGDKKSSDKKKSSGDHKKRKVHRMHLSRLHSGHFLAEHHYEPEEGMPNDPEQHAVEGSELMNHVGEHMGVGGPEPGAEPGAEPGVNPSAIPNLRPM
jgi:hypothetical protein